MTAWEVLGRAYRLFRWLLLAGCVMVLLLILRPDSPPSVPVDETALANLEDKIARVHQTASTQARELRLNEAELNGWLRSNLAVAPAPPPRASDDPSTASGGRELTLEEAQSNVRDVKVKLDGDRIHGYVLFELYGKDLSLTLTGRLELKDGYLRLEPSAMKLGSLPIPRATLERAVQRLFESPENREQFRVPSQIRDIRVENGDLIVVY